MIVFFQRETGGFLAVRFLLGIQAVGLHEVETPAAARLVLANDVQKDAVAVGEKFHRLTDLFAEIVQIRAVKIHQVKASLVGKLSPTGVGAVLLDLAPLGVIVGGEIIHASGEVNRCIDPCLLGGVILLA